MADAKSQPTGEKIHAIPAHGDDMIAGSAGLPHTQLLQEDLLARLEYRRIEVPVRSNFR